MRLKTVRNRLVIPSKHQQHYLDRQYFRFKPKMEDIPFWMMTLFKLTKKNQIITHS